MKYKHLFFDLDNTLYDFDTNAFLAMREAFTQLGLMEQLPPFEEFFPVYTKINDELWALYREKKVTKEVLRGLRFERSLGHFGVRPPIPYTEVDDCYLKEMTKQTNLFPETLDVLSELKKRGYVLHIITNGFKEVQGDKLINTGLHPLMTNVFISEDIKSPKPHREIFEYSIKSSNARKKESLMIGDSWESDIVGAKNFGIDQVYFNTTGEKPNYNGYGEPTYYISELKELLDLLP